MREQVLVKGEVHLLRSELFERDVVVYAPEEEVAFEVVFGCPDLRLHGHKEVLYQLPLLHRLREVVPPPEREPGCHDGARMPEQENDRHSGEVRAHPAEEQVGPYVLDQTPPRDDAPVEAVGPGVPEPAREREAGRLLKCPNGPTSLGLKGSKTYRYLLLWLMISESHVVPLLPLPARKTELLWSPFPRSTQRPPGSRERGAPIIVLSPARGCPSTRREGEQEPVIAVALRPGIPNVHPAYAIPRLRRGCGDAQPHSRRWEPRRRPSPP